MLKKIRPAALCDLFDGMSGDSRQTLTQNPMPRWAIPPLLKALFPSKSQRDLSYRFHNFDFAYGIRERTIETLATRIAQSQDNAKRFIAYVHLKGETMGHAVAMAFDPKTNQLTYQDPQGDAMPQFLHRFFAQEQFRSLDVRNLKIKQQHDDTSCSYISLYNLACMVHGDKITRDIDVDLLRQNMHAIVDEAIDDLRNGLSPQVMRERLWEIG